MEDDLLRRLRTVHESDRKLLACIRRLEAQERALLANIQKTNQDIEGGRAALRQVQPAHCRDAVMPSITVTQLNRNDDR